MFLNYSKLMEELILIIDFHNHFYPEAYIEEIRSGNCYALVTEDGQNRLLIHYAGDYNIVVGPHLNIEDRLRAMDRCGVDMQVLTLTTPGVERETPEQGEKLAKLTNNEFGEIIEEPEIVPEKEIIPKEVATAKEVIAEPTVPEKQEIEPKAIPKTEDLKSMVEEAGGVWKGIQEMPKGHESRITFNDPETKSTLMLKMSEATPENIKKDIEKTRKAFKEAKVKKEIKEEPLIEEAKKYKSAEEFVESFNITKQNKSHKELSQISKEIDVEEFGKKILLPETEFGIKTDDTVIENWEKRIEKGERPLVVVGGDFMSVVDGQNRLKAYKNLKFNKIPTVFKSQLTDIWNKANKIKKAPKPLTTKEQIEKETGVKRQKITAEKKKTDIEVAKFSEARQKLADDIFFGKKIEQLKQKGVKLKQKVRDIKEAQQAIYQYARDVKINAETFNKVDRLIRDAKNFNDVQKAVDEIDKTLEKKINSKLTKHLEKEIKKEKKFIKGIKGKKRTKRDVDINNQMQEFLNQFTSITEKKLEQINKNIVEFEKNSEQEMPEQLQKDIVELVKKNVKTMTNKEIRSNIKELKDIRKGAKLKGLKKEKARREKVLRQSFRANKEIQEVTKKKAKASSKIFEESKYKKVLDSSKNNVNKYRIQHLLPEKIFEETVNFKKNSVFVNNAYGPMVEAERTKLKGIKEFTEKFNKIHKDLDVANIMTTIIETSEGSISMNKALDLYANSQHQDNLDHVLATLENETDNPQALLDEVISKIPAKNKKAVDNMIDFMSDELYPLVNEVFKREHKIDLPKVDRYFPIMFLETNNNINHVLQDILARATGRQAISKNFTNLREGGKNAFESLGYMEKVVNHIFKVNHYIAYNDAVREVNEFLSLTSDSIKKQDPFLLKEMRDFVNTMALGKVRTEDTSFNNVLRFLRTNYVSSVLGLNIRTILKQPASFVNGMAKTDTGFVLKSVEEMIKNPFKLNDLVNSKSEFVANRANTLERALQEQAESRAVRDVLKTQKISEQVKNFAMSFIRLSDKITVNTIWYAKYAEVFDKTKNEQFSIKAADKVIRDTQPGGGLLTMSKVFRSGELQRAFTAFTSQLNKNFNMVNEIAKGWHERSTQENIKQSALVLVIAPSIIYLVDKAANFLLGRKEDKEIRQPVKFARYFISNILGSLFLTNKVTDTLIKVLSKEQKIYYAPEKTFMPISMQGISNLIRGLVGKKIDKTFWATMQLIGFPYIPFKIFLDLTKEDKKKKIKFKL